MGEDDDCHIKDFLIKVTLMNLREAVRDYARHECQGCRIDHPSQKYHELCLWTSPQEWIQDYKYHEPALEDWDETICDYLMNPKARKLFIFSHQKKPIKAGSQRELTDQWKKFWAKKMLESYIAEEKTEEQTKSEEKKKNKKQKSVTGQNHLHHQYTRFEVDTMQLTRLLNNMTVKGEFCAKDQLPEKKSSEIKAYIVNTDLSEDPGEHWVTVYFRGNRAIYFDSYGMSPDQDYILPFIKRNSTGWI